MIPNAHIAALAPYALADLAPEMISLAQNESAFPPSPRAMEAAWTAMKQAHLYPDPDWTDLRSAISEVHGIPPQSILCGAGSMELIGALAAAYLGPGDRALTAQYGYAFFATATRLAGAEIDFAPERDLTVDIDDLLIAILPETKIVFLANPGNPTGTRIPRAEIVRLREELPRDTILVVDEAYGEFADAPGEAVFDMVDRGDTIVLRTFSKAYALAGMRIGWGVFPSPVAAELRKLLNPNNISGPAQASAAAAMRDRKHLHCIIAETAERRDAFIARLRALLLNVPNSHTNFVLIGFGDAAKAAKADRALRTGGILMRGIAGYGLPDFLRATIGDEDAMRRAGDILEETLR